MHLDRPERMRSLKPAKSNKRWEFEDKFAAATSSNLQSLASWSTGRQPILFTYCTCSGLVHPIHGYRLVLIKLRFIVVIKYSRLLIERICWFLLDLEWHVILRPSDIFYFAPRY
jgi:hypothetical protein